MTLIEEIPWVDVNDIPQSQQQTDVFFPWVSLCLLNMIHWNILESIFRRPVICHVSLQNPLILLLVLWLLYISNTCKSIHSNMVVTQSHAYTKPLKSCQQIRIIESLNHDWVERSNLRLNNTQCISRVLNNLSCSQRLSIDLSFSQRLSVDLSC